MRYNKQVARKKSILVLSCVAAISSNFQVHNQFQSKKPYVGAVSIKTNDCSPSLEIQLKTQSHQNQAASDLTNLSLKLGA